MPYLYIYSPSDFVGGLPDEVGGSARVNGRFFLTLAADAEPTLVEVDDDDGTFHEVGDTQTLARDIVLDGVSYSAGTTINASYDLIRSRTGHQVTTLHFGGDGYEQGAVHGLISSIPLQPGTSYRFNRARTSWQQNNAYVDFVACFTRGCRIQTPDGDVEVENLSIGDQVVVRNGESRPIRKIYRRYLSTIELEANPNLYPVRIVAGAMGKGLPKRDLLVSPQHRMVADAPMLRRRFDSDAVFLSAKKLTEMPGIFSDHQVTEVEYFHIVLDEHEVIFAEGAPTESFYCGDQAFEALSEDARMEILQLFPELASRTPPLALVAPSGGQQKRLVKRLARREQQALAAPV